MSKASDGPGFEFRSGEREALSERLAQHRSATARLVVAIDGPAGSGKSTTARRVAERLGSNYLDTGAMYRAITFAALRAGIPSTDEAALGRLAQNVDLHVEGEGIWLDGEDVREAIRSPEVTAGVSRVSAVAGVRAAMLERQRALAHRAGTVMDGRDIGTVVLPGADLKVFLTADVQTRARRRQAEEEARGRRRDLQDIEREIRERDHADSTRASAPLQCAADAVRLDTTALSIDEQVDAVVALALRAVTGAMVPPDATPPGATEAAGPATGETEAGAADTDDEWLDPGDWAQPGYRRFHGGFYRLTYSTVGILIRQIVGLRRRIHPAARGQGSVLVACNHISILDPPAVSTALPFEVWFVAKRELFRNAVFGRVIRNLNAFPIRRGTADYEALDRAVELLRAGRNVLMFPEGTRQTPGRLGAPRWGFGYVAFHAERPIVPAFVRGTRDWRPRGLRREPMQVWVGAPYWPRRVAAAQANQEHFHALGAQAMQRIAGLMLRSAAAHPLDGVDPAEVYAAGAAPDVFSGG